MDKLTEKIVKLARSRLLRNILLVSVLAAFVFPFFSQFYLTPAFRNIVVANYKISAGNVAEHWIKTMMPQRQWWAPDMFTPELVGMLKRYQDDFHIERIKVFSENGTIIFSTAPAEVGTLNEHRYFTGIVAKGDVHTKLVRKGRTTLENRLVNKDILEIYIPVMSDGRFKGAFEFYYDITAQWSLLSDLLFRNSVIHFAIAATLLSGMLVILLKAAGSMIQRDRAQSDLRRINLELEENITDRTRALEETNDLLLSEIEDRKAAERYLDYYRLIINTSRDLMTIIDRDYIYLAVNNAYKAYFSLESRQIQGRHVREIIGEAVFDTVLKRRIDEAFSGETVSYRSWITYPAKGRRFMSVSYYPVKDRDGQISAVVGHLRDATKNKMLRDRLVQSQKMESIGTLAGGIAHDFNNILSAIMGFSQLAFSQAEDGSTLKDDIKEIYSASVRAKELVQQILTFARQSDDGKEPVAMKPLVKEALKFLRSSIPATIDIRQEIDSDVMVMGHPTKLHQIIMNLSTNAVHAMAEKGVLTITLRDVSFETDTPVFTGILSRGRYAELSVSDTGTGIDPDIVKSIFEPYFTTKDVGQGTGMGLSLVHGIVKDCAGEIMLETGPGKGTAVRVYLPVVTAAEDQGRECTGDACSGSERILFVDDEAVIAKMVDRQLSQLGYRVTTATDSLEALALFRKDPTAFDLVVSDLIMPKMTGEELALESMAIRADIPVILCTGNRNRLTAQRVGELGIKAVSYKPFENTSLAETIRRVMDSGP